MIDKNTINKIFTTANIVEVISDYVQLKKAGQNFRGLSPFKNEKTPSFFVSPSKGIFKCFSTGIGGNVVSFLMEHEKISYPEALRYLAKKYNIEISEKEESEEEKKAQSIRESLLSINQFACNYFMETLNTEDGKAIGISYFAERGFRSDIIRKFQLGYSRDDKTALLKRAGDKGYKIDFLLQTGLVIKHDNYLFDRFHSRIIFPIHSLSGQISGFAGRIIKSTNKTAKYINSPESEIFHKGDMLYGLYFARQSILKNDKCFLVEGYTDVISLHQNGIENVVSSSGTALTINQIRLIKRFTHNITVLYDGDDAGIKASLRGIDLLLEEGLNVRVVLLPSGEDPDSFARKNNASSFINFIETSETDFITFKVKLLAKEAENDPIKKASLIREIVGSISVIPESIVRSVYIRECSKLFDIDENLLYAETTKMRRNRAGTQNKYPEIKTNVSASPKNNSDKSFSVQSEKYNAEKEVIKLLILYGNSNIIINKEENQKSEIKVADYFFREIEKDELGFHHPILNIIYYEIKKMIQNEQYNFEQQLIMHSDDSIGKMVVDLVTSAYDLSRIWRKHENYIATEEMRISEIVPEALLAFKNEKVMRLLRETESEIKNAQLNSEIERIQSLQNKFIILNNLKKELSKGLGDRIII